MNFMIVRRLVAVLILTVATEVAPALEKTMPMPACELQGLADSQSLDLKQFHGKVIYVDFWASWCGPCVKSFPYMNQLIKDLKGQGLEVIGVNLDENPEDAKTFLETNRADFIIAADKEEKCAREFAVKGMPSSYLIDRNGMIRYDHLGFRPGEAEEFRGLVEKLLAEK
jgi:thiol-disulfide isomerase/thioredoxin